MRRWVGSAACLVLVAAGIDAAGIGAAKAEPGSLFKNLFGGGGSSGGGEAPAMTGPRAFDPDDTYCPAIAVSEGGAAVQSFAGAAGDNSRLRHQITLGRLGRECTTRAGGAVGVKVGVQVRALLGPAGASGTFSVPLTVAVAYNDTILASRTRQVSIAVPAGAAQGSASVVEEELLVPADKTVGYDIVVALGGQQARAKTAARASAKSATKSTAKRGEPATAEAAVGDLLATGQ